MNIIISIPIPKSINSHKVERGIEKLKSVGVIGARVRNNNASMMDVIIEIPDENTLAAKEQIATLGFTLGMLFSVEICKL